MSSDLRFICQSLLANRKDQAQYDAILLQFISAIEIDSVLLANFAADESFPMFVQCLLYFIHSAQGPSGNDARTLKRMLPVIEFMTDIASQNPDVAHIIAANIPGDAFLSEIFRRAPERGGQTKETMASRYLPFIKLITILACESDLFLSSNEGLSLYVPMILKLFEDPEAGAWAVSSFAALIKNCPAASSYVKASPSFPKLKVTLASLLSSEDPCVVIASLCSMVLLFPAAITPETSIKAAVNAIESLDEFHPTVYLVSWIVMELNESCPITAEDTWKILRCAMKGGVKAHVAYNLMIKLTSMHALIIDVMQGMNCLFALINSILDCDDGFVAIAGCSFLFTVFQDTNDFILSEDVVEPFIKALHLVLAMRKHTQTDRREAGVLLLRFMVRSRESVTYLIKILQEYEEQLFVDFQRQIEMNNAYLSVVYFLFLYDASHFLSHWRQKLISLVLESQFPGLITYVLTASRNRCAIADALRTSQIIADGFKTDVVFKSTPMFESLVGSYVLLNQRRFESDRKERAENTQVQEELMTKLSELEARRDSYEKEIVSARSSVDEHTSSMVAEQEQNRSFTETNAHLKHQLSQNREKIKSLSERLKELEDTNATLAQQVDCLQRRSNQTSLRAAGMRTKLSSITQLEAALRKVLESNEKLDGTLQQLKGQEEKDKATITQMKSQLENLKLKFAAIQQKNSQITKILAAHETEKEQLAQQCSSLQKNIKALTREKAQLTESETESSKLCHELKCELAQAQHERDRTVKKVESRTRTVNELQERLTSLEDHYMDFQMLVKLIHKTTEPNQRLPPALSSFMKL